MPAKYHPLVSGIWNHPKLDGAPFEEKAFFAYLFSNDHVRPSGIYRVSTAQLAAGVSKPEATVEQWLADLSQRRLIVRDGLWIFIRGYLKRQPKQKFLLRGASQDVKACTSLLVLMEFSQYYPAYKQWSADRLAKVGQPSPDRSLKSDPTDAEQVQSRAGADAEQDSSAASAAGSDSAGHARGWTVPTWTAYSEAYRARYGVEPTRNRRVNGKMADFVDSVPRSDAPGIAAFFVQHNGYEYVRSGHAVGLLLRDAEKLRTEWLTGRRVSEMQARQADERQELGDMARRLIAKAREEGGGGNAERANRNGAGRHAPTHGHAAERARDGSHGGAPQQLSRRAASPVGARPLSDRTPPPDLLG